MFTNYTDILLSSLSFNPKFTEIVARRQSILDNVYALENLTPQSILFVGFNPAILGCRAKTIAVTEISDTAIKYLKDNGVKFTHINSDDLGNYGKQFQAVIAMDEYFTFATSDADQQQKISLLCGLATNFIVSTMRDYKNQDFKEKEFSQPLSVRDNSSVKMFFEHHEWDQIDRQRWETSVYEIDYPSNTTKIHGNFDRRTVYFKQLAKFSIDSGAANFLVHKNLMYKSVIRRNYEHVVSIQFD